MSDGLISFVLYDVYSHEILLVIHEKRDRSLWFLEENVFCYGGSWKQLKIGCLKYDVSCQTNEHIVNFIKNDDL